MFHHTPYVILNILFIKPNGNFIFKHEYIHSVLGNGLNLRNCEQTWVMTAIFAAKCRKKLFLRVYKN